MSTFPLILMCVLAGWAVGMVAGTWIAASQDFTPVVMVSYSPHVLAVNPEVQVKNVQELLHHLLFHDDRDFEPMVAHLGLRAL